MVRFISFQCVSNSSENNSQHRILIAVRLSATNRHLPAVLFGANVWYYKLALCIWNVDITNSMEQSPSWKDTIYSASQKNHRLLYNPKVHDVFTTTRHWSLSWVRWIQSSTSPPSLRSFLIWSFHLRLCLPSSLFVCISHVFHACYMPRPSHPPWLDHPNNYLWSVHKLWCSWLCSLLQPPTISLPHKGKGKR